MSIPNEVCPVCGVAGYIPFFELNDVPVQDGVLWNSRAAALAAPTGNIRLAYCRSCGYIGNLLFDPEKIRYDQEYSFSLHFSTTYQEFIHSLAGRLVEEYQLENKTILEIGCGQGDFLRILCGLGSNTGIGIDPSATSRVEKIGRRNITYFQDYYSGKYAGLEVDFICCRQVLDQISTPKNFIETVRKNLEHRQDTVVYFEVPNAGNIFEEMLIRNIIYEKSSWFTTSAITRMFELSGFNVISAEPCFEAGQYIGVESTPSQVEEPKIGNDPEAGDRFERSIASFDEKYQQKIKSWDDQLKSIQQSGRKAIAWGAGSGAINFFSLLKNSGEIPCVIDINPRRQGQFLPISGQQVVPPEYLQEYGAEIVVITNATYEREIKQQVADQGVECDFWVL